MAHAGSCWVVWHGPSIPMERCCPDEHFLMAQRVQEVMANPGWVTPKGSTQEGSRLQPLAAGADPA